MKAKKQQSKKKKDFSFEESRRESKAKGFLGYRDGRKEGSKVD